MVGTEVTVQQIAGPPAPETLRRDQLARRQKIVRTALRALAGSEYEQVKISQVARDAGVALGTLYRYFVSKEHLFAAVFVEWEAAFRDKVQRVRPEGDTEADRLRNVMHRTIKAFQLQPQFYRLMMMLDTTTDTYAAETYSVSESQFRASVQMAFDGALDDTRAKIYRTVIGVLDNSLRGWLTGKMTIKDVYRNVDNAIWLIYEYRPE
jgi:AcrR family transcriptional regulator